MYDSIVQGNCNAVRFLVSCYGAAVSLSAVVLIMMDADVVSFCPFLYAHVLSPEHDRHLQDFNSACRQLEAFFVLKQHSGNPPSDAQLRAVS